MSYNITLILILLSNGHTLDNALACCWLIISRIKSIRLLRATFGPKVLNKYLIACDYYATQLHPWLYQVTTEEDGLLCSVLRPLKMGLLHCLPGKCGWLSPIPSDDKLRWLYASDDRCWLLVGTQTIRSQRPIERPTAVPKLLRCAQTAGCAAMSFLGRAAGVVRDKYDDRDDDDTVRTNYANK